MSAGDPPTPPERPSRSAGSRSSRPDKPDYTVYRSRPRLSDRFGKPNLGSLRERLSRRSGGDRGPRPARPERPGEDVPLWRRAVRWSLIGILVWILVSLAAFAVSAQIQKWKLADGITDQLDGNPFLLASPQTILVLGTDVRSGAFAGPAEAETKDCLEAIGSGRSKDGSCRAAPYRSDTLMLVRAGRGTFRKLSIPRDTLADVPGLGPQKINSAYAAGGAKLAIRTVERTLGLDVDQVAIIDFDGFRRFIDTIGGIEVDLPSAVCSSVSDGAFRLDLKKGETELNGFQAITLARTRTSGDCDGDGLPDQNLSDESRAGFQQLILDGIKGKLTSITAMPINLIKGPLIGWNAPRAMVSSMGALTMPQLVIAAGIGGGGSDVLEPSGTTAAGNLVVSPEECARAAEKLLGSDPPREPSCPQG